VGSDISSGGEGERTGESLSFFTLIGSDETQT
jgi:hypothetical protein